MRFLRRWLRRRRSSFMDADECIRFADYYVKTCTYPKGTAVLTVLEDALETEFPAIATVRVKP